MALSSALQSRARGGMVILACVLMGAVLWPASPAGATVIARKVALSGERAPGTPDDVIFTTVFADVALDPNGRVAFLAKVSGPGISYENENERGLWSDVTGTLGKLAWAGEQPYGMPPGRVYWSFAYGVNQTAGTAAFKCIAKPSPYRDGIWAGRPGDLSLVAAEGEPAHGMIPGISYSTLYEPSINRNGQLGVRGTVQGPGANQWNNEAMWVFGGTRLVAYGMQQAPGVPAGVGFWRFTENPRINSLGRVAFQANLQWQQTYWSNGVWAESSGPLELVALAGTTAPGTTALYNMFWGHVGFNDGGEVSFSAKLSGTGVTSVNDNGVWVGTPGNVQLLAREGDPVPGRAETFTQLTSMYPKISHTGEVAFSYGYGLGICVGTPGSLSVVAHRDDHAAGTPTGVLFDYLAYPSINRHGEVAFTGSLKGPSVTADNDRGLWAQVGDQMLLVLREGDPLEVAPGVTKTVSDISTLGFSGNEDGLVSVWNDNRQVAFEAGFTDGSRGVFVANVFGDRGATEDDPILPTVAEPGPGGEWTFDRVPGEGRWFDPTPADLFEYAITDGVSKFTRVGLPAGLGDADGQYVVTDAVNGSFVVAEGDFHTFDVAVDYFTVTGIDPAVDGEDPLAFPTYLEFDQEVVSFEMTPVPGPATLSVLGLGGVLVLRKKRRA